MESLAFTSTLTFFLSVATIGSTAVAAYMTFKYRALVESNRTLAFHRDIDAVYRHIDDMLDEIRDDLKEQDTEIGNIRRDLAEGFEELDEKIHRETSFVQATVPCLTPKEIALVRGLAVGRSDGIVDDEEVEA